MVVKGWVGRLAGSQGSAPARPALPLMVVLFAVCLMFVDGFGARPPRSRCHGLYGIARVCTANAAAPTTTRAQKYGNLFQYTYNQEAKANRWPHRIDLILCKPDGEAIFNCVVKLRFVTTGQVECGVLVIDTGFNVWVNHKAPCRKLFKAGGQAA